jgi:hypothetical protein
VRADTLGQIGTALRAEMSLVPEKVRRQLLLAESPRTVWALGNAMFPAVAIERHALFIGEGLGSPTIRMENLSVLNGNGLIGEDPLLTPCALRLGHKATVGTIDALGRRVNARPDHLTPVSPQCTISRSAIRRSSCKNDPRCRLIRPHHLKLDDAHCASHGNNDTW